MVNIYSILVGLVPILIGISGCSSLPQSETDFQFSSINLANQSTPESCTTAGVTSGNAQAHLTSIRPLDEQSSQVASQTQLATNTNGLLNDRSDVSSTLSNNFNGGSFLKLSLGEQRSKVFLLSVFQPEVQLVQSTEVIPGPALLDNRESSWYFSTPIASEVVTPIRIEEPNREYSIPRIWRDILSDHQNFYSCRNLSWLGIELGVGAMMANTTIDQNLRNFYQENVRDAATDEFYEALHLPKVFGQGVYPFAIYSSALLLGSWAHDDSTFGIAGQWGERTLRGMLLGGPPMLLLQKATGGSRPEETTHGSNWEFFQDNNGVSGHAFMGAMPFITAAQMTDNIWLKGTFYAASTLTGLSRINDDAHYSSQVFLGWGIAFLAVSSVSQTANDNRSFRIIPLPVSNSTGLAFEYRY